MHKLSNLLYCSKWFCVLKKDKKSPRLVHDLQPLNAVAIQDIVSENTSRGTKAHVQEKQGRKETGENRRNRT